MTDQELPWIGPSRPLVSTAIASVESGAVATTDFAAYVSRCSTPSGVSPTRWHCDTLRPRHPASTIIVSMNDREPTERLAPIPASAARRWGCGLTEAAPP